MQRSLPSMQHMQQQMKIPPMPGMQQQVQPIMLDADNGESSSSDLNATATVIQVDQDNDGILDAQAKNDV